MEKEPTLTIEHNGQFHETNLSDRELLLKVAAQNDRMMAQNEQMIALMSEALNAVKEFQSGGMGKMIAGMFGGK